ncbi:MAG: transporter substrate-binding domain-containing protein [Piscinibacter sp.]|uniref:substrate-binding periplasmic protein n=1 Tax=Piscinibacter sp. TaxID=1903157 RepID=UPI001B717EEA|nr:transporter substrate-binding domain-containing protein [Piscinibacter sp.]MBP5992035.1 transporter substrate-binding domain-containing protein [Piscinibacter sp.]MBP6029572.1 transporter substrate-binding domain-containing protein [Piscinibacter sp.]
MIGRRGILRALGAGPLAATLPELLSATPLSKVKSRGSLVVGLYKDMPPFHADGAGIDVELGRALAESLGVAFSPLPFPADENMGDDLRNMVWKGHYLGYGPADVLLHVPVDRPLMEANPQVRVFAPYWRERVMIARNVEQLPALDSLAALAGKAVAVPGQSLAGWLLIGAEGGALRDSLSTKWNDGVEAAKALQRGEVLAAAGLASELQAVLRGDARFVIEPLPSPRAPRDGWAVGMAVKKDATELAQALQAAVNQLAGSGRLAEIFARANLAWRPV